MSHHVPADASSDRSQLAVPPSERDYRQGSLTAQVLLVEYGYYQCPQCKELRIRATTHCNHRIEKFFMTR